MRVRGCIWIMESIASHPDENDHPLADCMVDCMVD